jgi:hypothetical protein
MPCVPHGVIPTVGRFGRILTSNWCVQASGIQYKVVHGFSLSAIYLVSKPSYFRRACVADRLSAHFSQV